MIDDRGYGWIVVGVFDGRPSSRVEFVQLSTLPPGVCVFATRTEAERARRRGRRRALLST